MGAILRLASAFDGLLDLSPLSALTGAPLDVLGEAPLVSGRGEARADALFTLAPQPGDTLTLCGDLSRAIRIGAGLAHGTICVEGDAGPEAGLLLCGGTLHIRGSAGDDALMRMENGFARIDGSAGADFASSMRRGTAVVYGRCGSGACRSMRGGTALLLGGAEEADLARDMRRGTVCLPAGNAVPAAFSRAADVDISFMRLLLCELKKRGLPLPEDWYGAAFTRLRGDPAALGKGELMLKCGARA